MEIGGTIDVGVLIDLTVGELDLKLVSLLIVADGFKV